jgi:hypothetical protein
MKGADKMPQDNDYTKKMLLIQLFSTFAAHFSTSKN